MQGFPKKTPVIENLKSIFDELLSDAVKQMLH